MAVTGGFFVLLLTLALILNAGQGAESSDAESSEEGSSQQSRRPAKGEAGGDSRTTNMKLVNGVPVGYAHTQGGAVQAAVNYQVARSSAKYFTEQEVRHKTLAAMMTTGSLNKQTQNDDRGMRQIVTSLGITNDSDDQLVARGSAMGTKVTTYTDEVTTVNVWMAGLVGTTNKSSPMPVSASWTTYTLTLQWQANDWKLSSVTSVNGPTPLDTGSGNPTSVDEFANADREFNAPPYAG
ncbi:hypothetical protein HOK021_16480 [Streptomyces hygroscopicus]|nr:hypothetical protein HOK021_16480 [Streptomyces hygroscopicus]